MVAIAGDLADVASPVPVEVQSRRPGRLPRPVRRRTPWSSPRRATTTSTGRASTASRSPAGCGAPRAASVVTDGGSVDVDGTRFTVCPWWDGPHSREAVEAQLAAAAVDRPERWVWVYHSPPAGTVLCRDGRREFPDHDLAGWIAQHEPDLVLCGHIHQAPWVDGGSWHARLGSTRVFNPGRQPGPVPPHVVLDTDAGTAEWYGVYDSETVAIALTSGRAHPSGSRAEPVGPPGRWWCTKVSRICADHPEVTVLAGELGLHVGEVLRQPSSRVAVVRSTASAAPGRSMRKATRVVDHPHPYVRRGAQGRRRGLLEHDRHLAEHGAGRVDAGDRHPVALDRDGAGLEHQHPARLGALGDQHGTRRRSTRRAGRRRARAGRSPRHRPPFGCPSGVPSRTHRPDPADTPAPSEVWGRTVSTSGTATSHSRCLSRRPSRDTGHVAVRSQEACRPHPRVRVLGPRRARGRQWPRPADGTCRSRDARVPAPSTSRPPPTRSTPRRSRDA